MHAYYIYYMHGFNVCSVRDQEEGIAHIAVTITKST